MSIKVPLANSDKEALLDDDNAHLLRHEWYLTDDGHASREKKLKSGKKVWILMENEVMGLVGE